MDIDATTQVATTVKENIVVKVEDVLQVAVNVKATYRKVRTAKTAKQLEN